jgi:hypothetical protein
MPSFVIPRAGITVRQAIPVATFPMSAAVSTMLAGLPSAFRTTGRSWRQGHLHHCGSARGGDLSTRGGGLSDVVTAAVVGAAARIAAVADRSTLHNDGKDLVWVSVALNDAKGGFVPTDHRGVRFAVDRPGEIVATDNGDPTVGPFLSGHPVQAGTRAD